MAVPLLSLAAVMVEDEASPPGGHVGIETVGTDRRRPPRAAIPAFVAAAIGGVPVVAYLVLSHGHDMSASSPREDFVWALLAGLAVATLSGAILWAAGWRLGQALLYGAAATYFAMGALVILTGLIFFPAAILAVLGAGRPRIPAPVMAASVALPWIVFAVGLSLTG